MRGLEKSCPCCSGREYEKCCKPFHEGAFHEGAFHEGAFHEGALRGGVWPENALQLMRSRFSAYALDLPDYIMATTHVENPEYSKNKNVWKRSISAFSTSTSFKDLKILHVKEEGNFASVTFTAHLFQGAQDISFTEKSYFEKNGEKWLYRSGEYGSS